MGDNKLTKSQQTITMPELTPEERWEFDNYCHKNGLKKGHIAKQAILQFIRSKST